MTKYWLGVALVLLSLMIPAVAKADELPPGDEVIINESTVVSPVGSTEMPAGMSDQNPYPFVPGIPVPAPDSNNQNGAELPASTTPEAQPVPALKETLVAEFATPLINSPINRNHNINQALMTLNGQVIKPGTTWSFNQAVGPRTIQRGYKEAIIIVNKKFVPGIGGGICQVASTLYNVILAAKLKVIERHPHSLPVKYVLPGKDAAISYGVQDLKFTNNLSQEIVIKSEMENKKVVVAFYARQAEPAAANSDELIQQ